METPKLFDHPVFHDDRGIFNQQPIVDYYNRDIDRLWIQSNTSVSHKKFTLRGLHFQEEPFEQTKYVKIIKGRVLDFVVDLRKYTKNYKSVYFFDLDDTNALMVPKGFAHGLVTLEDDTIITYLTDNKYNPSKERTLQWDTIPEIKERVLELIGDSDLILSEKDRLGLSYDEY